MPPIPRARTRYLREISWADNSRDQNHFAEFPVGDELNLTVMVLSTYNNCLFAGLDNGNLRVYEWPLNGNFVEYPSHKAAVTSLRMSPDETRLISAGEDGSLVIFGLQRVENSVELPFVLEAEGAPMLNGEFFLVAQEELTDRQQEFNEMKKLYDDLKSDSDYNLKRKDTEWTEELKNVQEVGAGAWRGRVRVRVT